MRQFDVHQLKAGPGRLVLILQNELTDMLDSCVVAPVMPAGPGMPITRLRPALTFQGQGIVVAIDRMAAIERRAIGHREGTLLPFEAEFKAAIDLLFFGL
jgi:hypothetical protein